MENPSNTLTIREFAFKKQAPKDGLVNAVMNGVLTYFLLAGIVDIPVISPPGSGFSHSLLGTLVMPAIVIAFVISLMTSKVAVKKRIKGEILPSLDAGVPWVKVALKWGIARAVLNVFIVYGLGGMLIQISPNMRVSRLAAEENWPQFTCQGCVFQNSHAQIKPNACEMMGYYSLLSRIFVRREDGALVFH